MRIGLVAADFWPNVGGLSAHVVKLVPALLRQGHRVDVITRPLGANREPLATLDGMQVHRPRLPQLRPFSHWALHRWLRQFVERQPLDLLHVHGLRPMPAVRGLGLPVVFTNQTSGFLQRLERGWLAKRRVARHLAAADAILAPSEELAAATRSLQLPTPVRYIPNGVDPLRFRPDVPSARGPLGIPERDVVVLLARRLVAKNGVCVFAEAASGFIRPGVRILFAGDGPERAEVEAILRRTGSLRHATFLGNVPNTQMPAIYRAADISVLPSFLEATSITGLESMATGLPLVGTRVGGIPALIDHERTGLLVNPGDPVGLAAAIARLIELPAQRLAYGEAARQRILAEFSWDVIARSTVEEYERLLEATAHGDPEREETRRTLGPAPAVAVESPGLSRGKAA